MPFIEIPGGKGKLFIPADTPPATKKHPCSDCAVCQQCSDERCEMCLKQKNLPAHPIRRCGVKRRRHFSQDPVCCRRDGEATTK